MGSAARPHTRQKVDTCRQMYHRWGMARVDGAWRAVRAGVVAGMQTRTQCTARHGTCSVDAEAPHVLGRHVRQHPSEGRTARAFDQRGGVHPLGLVCVILDQRPWLLRHRPRR